MIETYITPELIQQAKEKSEEMGRLNNSITSGEGNIAGFLGEFLVADLIQAEVTNTYNYDLTKNGYTFDVKTKRCTSKPYDHYECSIAEYNTKQQCDFYIFVRIEYTNEQWKRAWVLGFYPKPQYFKNARYLKKGAIDGSNKFTVKANCYNMYISDLYSLEQYVVT